ncbi:MAG: 4'-phosphopantetheinyl transferase superfamily protein [Chloroflexota bacterium]
MQWQWPPAELGLADDEVHVWRVGLERPFDTFWPLLSAAEQARAERFHFARDRRRYTVGRGTVRTVLAKYLGVDPASLVLDVTKFGKPFLVNHALHFNLSHSQEVGLLAVCRSSVVGVDVEEKRPLSDLHSLAAHVFSPVELQTLHALPPAQQPGGFFNAWTRKEAFIKAIGEGFSYPLKEFDVTLAPGDPAAIVQVQGSTEEAATWSLHLLPPLPGFASALVLKAGHWRLSCWHFG